MLTIFNAMEKPSKLLKQPFTFWAYLLCFFIFQFGISAFGITKCSQEIKRYPSVVDPKIFSIALVLLVLIAHRKASIFLPKCIYKSLAISIRVMFSGSGMKGAQLKDVNHKKSLKKKKLNIYWRLVILMKQDLED